MLFEICGRIIQKYYITLYHIQYIILNFRAETKDIFCSIENIGGAESSPFHNER